MLPDWYQRKPRKRISPTDKVSLKLTDRQRKLIIEHTFAPDYLTDGIRLGRWQLAASAPRWRSRSMSGKSFTATSPPRRTTAMTGNWNESCIGSATSFKRSSIRTQIRTDVTPMHR